MWNSIVSAPDHCLYFYFPVERSRNYELKHIVYWNANDENLTLMPNFCEFVGNFEPVFNGSVELIFISQNGLENDTFSK